MGRGRKGITNQSTKKLVPRRHNNIAMVVGLPNKRDEPKISLPEEALEFMKKWINNSFTIFLRQTKTGTSKHQASMLLETDLT